MEIIPAIIAKSFEELKEKIKLVEPYVDWAQLDVMDGKFAPEKTWPYNGVSGNDKIETIGNLPEKLQTNINLEAHLMVEDVENEMEKWLDSGMKRILVHYESLISNLKSQISNPQLKCQNLINKFKGAGIEFGLVLNLETSIDVLDEISFLIHNYDFVVQLMSIAQIGYHGHPFDVKVIHKVELLRQKHPNVKISLDGGVNQDVICKIAKVGVDNFVVGSAIFHSNNIKKTIEELKNKLH